jgi:hypothetical protein
MLLDPSLDNVRRAREAAEKEDAFWHAHYDTYLERYPDQFVAVAKDSGQIVAVDPDLDTLIGTVKRKGLDVHRVWVRFMAATPIRLVL